MTSVVVPGLNCLQRDFECNRNSPRYARFAINSGGAFFVSADGTEYEAEVAPLGAASFNVTSSKKWAVSNAGLYADRKSPTYTTTNLLQVSRTNTPELFQSSRSSPGSLRYYGLGLENGDYTVNLLFAETGFPDQSSQTWESLARRVFDIYLQGSLRLKDFDISKEAGGVERAITKTFNVTVSDNHMEIHLFWAGKGTCCTPVQGYYGPTISALSVFSGKTAMQLDWPTRFSICLGTARGLAYLHEESSPQIVHRDVKASNILLDAELCPKISDFGLAKLYDDKKTHISTRVAGTIGYLAPEYAMRGHLTEKADVFGFGVVALEILSGRPTSDDTLDGEKIYLLEWVKEI